MAIHPSVRVIGALEWYSELTGLRIAEAWIFEQVVHRPLSGRVVSDFDVPGGGRCP
jgi:hypothetical protein